MSPPSLILTTYPSSRFPSHFVYWLQHTRLNAPKATLQTSAVAPAASSPMVGIGGRMQAAEALLLMAPGVALGAAVAAGLWLERTAVARGAAALARGAVAWVCAAASCRWAGRRGGGGQQQQQQQQRQRWQELGTPLLGSAAVGEEEEGEEAAAVVAVTAAAASAAGQNNPKLVGNARGLRLAFTSHV